MATPPAHLKALNSKGLWSAFTWSSKTPTVALTSLAFVSFLIKALLAFNTFGTNDILMYRTSLEKLQRVPGIRMYQEQTVRLEYQGKRLWDERFNHPPFMIPFLRGLGAVSAALGLAFHITFRLFISMADSACFLLVCLLMKEQQFSVDLFRALALMAVCPAAILIAGFHGNSDPLMIFFVLLSVWFFERKSNVLLAGAALGMAMNIKIVPVLLIPALLFHIPSWRRRIFCLSAIATVFLIPGIPYLLQDARSVIRAVFMYDSMPGSWGFSFLASKVHLSTAPLNAYWKYGLLAAITTLSWWLNWRVPRLSLFNQFGLILSVFLFFSPGFGIQYLYWLVPWVVCLGAGITALQYFSQGVFAFLVYNSWSHGMPWFFAGAAWPWWRGRLAVLQLAVWASVGAALYAYMRLLRRRTQYEPGKQTAFQ